MISTLFKHFFNSSVCPGNKDDRSVEFCHCKKGKFLSIKKDIFAFPDTSDPLVTTVRHSSCHVLVQKEVDVPFVSHTEPNSGRNWQAVVENQQSIS